MSDKNVQAMRGLYEAFARGDMDAFEKGCSRDILWNEAENSLYSGGNPYRSFAAVRDGVFAPTQRDFDNFRVELEQLLDAGDYVIGTGRYRGRNKATGKELSAQFCHVIHVDPDGKLEQRAGICRHAGGSPGDRPHQPGRGDADPAAGDVSVRRGAPAAFGAPPLPTLRTVRGRIDRTAQDFTTRTSALPSA